MDAPPNFDDVLATLRRVALAAGDMILKGSESIRQKQAAGVDGAVKEKLNSADVVTETDEAVERFVAQELKSKYPQYKFIGEESDVNETLTDDPTFICDPIDGTMNFVHGHPYVSISLGLAYKLRPAVGVVYNPFYHHLYTAAIGRGAYFEDFRGKHRLPLTSPAPPLGGLRESLVLVEWGKEREGVNWETVVDTFKNLTAKDGGMVHDLRTFGGAALNLCTVAAGSVDMSWGGGWEAWDVCAGWAILLESGGRMFDGNPLKGFDEPAVDGKMYLAVRGALKGQEKIAEEFWRQVGGPQKRWTYEKGS